MEEFIPYSIAVGMFNLVFTVILVTVFSSWVFHHPITWGVLIKSYIVGYIVLWILNVKIIRVEGEK